MNSSSNGTEKISFLNKWKFKLKMLLFFKRRRTYKNTLYKNTVWTSIEDMPIWNWNKIVESGDLLYLYIDQNIKGFYSERLSDIWLDLQEQHLTEFGIDNMLRLRIKRIKRLIQLNIQYVKTRDRNLLNFIGILEAELKASEEQFQMRFRKVVDIVSTQKGFRLDIKEITVIEWYHALKNLTAHGNNN